jgi:prepilin-type processing-associated H-X9-DG protein
LPPGYNGPNTPSYGLTDPTQPPTPDPTMQAGPQVGVLVYLLPYVEQDNVYKLFFTGDEPVPADYLAIANTETSPWWWYSSALQASLSYIPTFMCPQDDPNVSPAAGIGVMLHAYFDPNASTAGMYYGWFSPDTALPETALTANDFGRTNYVGVAGLMGRASQYFANSPYADFAACEGLMCNRSNISLANLSAADGASNTMMFGESLLGAATGPRDYVCTWTGGSALPTYFGFPENTSPDDGGVQWVNFSSLHVGVVNFCFADGSVRSLRRGSDFATFVYLSGWSDGHEVDFSLVE